MTWLVELTAGLVGLLEQLILLPLQSLNLVVHWMLSELEIQVEVHQIRSDPLCRA